VNKEEKKIIGLTSASHSLVHLFEGVLPPLIPLLIGEFGTDYFHLGMVVTVFSYAFGAGSLPAGFFVDRVGSRRLLSFYLFGASILCIAVWSVQSLLAYGVIMGFIGLFCSTYHPAGNSLISLSIREKGRAFGIHGIAGSLGVAVVPVLSAWLGSFLGWRAPHVALGIVGIGVGLYSLTISRPTFGKVRNAKDSGEEVPEQAISYVNVAVFFLSATALGLTYKGIMTFLPAYMGKRVQLGFMHMDTVALGGTVATIALLSGAVGQYIAGRLVDFYRAEKIYLVSVLIATAFVFLMAWSSEFLLIAAAVIYAFFFFSTQTVQNYILSTYFPRGHQGLGYGIHFFLTFGVGSTAAAASGYLADQFGLASVFYFMGFFLIFSSIFVTILVARTQSIGKELEPSGAEIQE